MTKDDRARLEWSSASKSARGTRGLARRVAADLEPGSVLALVGDMGAGKTTFVQGLAEGLGVADLSQVLSPTYTLVNEYVGGRLTLVHIDFYRLDEPEAACALGLEEQLCRRDAVVAVEWADHLPDLLPAEAAWVDLAFSASGGREVRVRGLPRPASRSISRHGVKKN